MKEFGADKFEIVYPSVSILAEPPVAWVDKVDQRHGTAAISKAYLEFKYAPAGQEIIAQNFFVRATRPSPRNMQTSSPA